MPPLNDSQFLGENTTGSSINIPSNDKIDPNSISLKNPNSNVQRRSFMYPNGPDGI